MINRPDPQEYAPYFHTYISKVAANNLLQALADSRDKTLAFFRSLPEEKWEFRYAPGKWTIKEVVQHLIDCERVFVYRALSIARGEKTSLPGFDENEYARNGNANQLSSQALLAEYESVRRATLSLFENMSDEASKKTGQANNKPASARALGFCIAGHEQHHVEVIAERYLAKA